MSKTLLAIGAWPECARLITLALLNHWCVLHTPILDEISLAIEKENVDLILLTGCHPNMGGEGMALPTGKLHPHTPLITLDSGTSLDLLICALVGGFCCDAALCQETAPAEPPTLEDTASICTCSPITLTLCLLKPRLQSMTPGIQAALEYIEKHYAEPISLQTAADAAFYSRCHFSTLFKRQTGISFAIASDESPSSARPRDACPFLCINLGYCV